MAGTKLYTQLRREAESHYADAAAGYRQSDDAAKDLESHAGKCLLVRELTERFDKPIRMLDLGCGTGRYFHCVRNVEWLVGVDPSQQMLEHARTPVGGVGAKVTLLRSSLHEVAFNSKCFDLVICVGVLTYWCPVDAFVMKRVAAMLRDDGQFFFTVREPIQVRRTFKRSVATMIRPLLFGPPRRYVDSRLADFGVSEDQVKALVEPFFKDIQIQKWRSASGRTDLHCVASGVRQMV